MSTTRVINGREYVEIACLTCGSPTGTLVLPGDERGEHCSGCDMCQCGLSRADHGGLDGHGGNATCRQFTWAGFRKPYID